MKNFMFVGLVVMLFAAGPLLLIWALNTLFPLAIPYEFKTWLAAFILIGAIKTNVTSVSKID